MVVFHEKPEIGLGSSIPCIRKTRGFKDTIPGQGGMHVHDKLCLVYVYIRFKLLNISQFGIGMF